jgi:hypothetical protein
LTPNLAVRLARRGRARFVANPIRTSTAIVAWLALLLFVVVTVGPSLFGGTFLNGLLLTNFAPWQSTLEWTRGVTNGMTSDTVDAVYPQAQLVASAAQNGDFAQWYPYSNGGAELAGLPNSGMYSPASWPLWVLPGQFAMSWVKVSEIVAVTVGMSLFLRRFNLPSASWALASLAYVSSGFMIAWTNWPQTRVAAFIPLLFWAVDKASTSVRWAAAVPLALASAALLLGGFPAVAGYAFYAAALYCVLRSITFHRSFRPTLTSLFITLGGVLGGVALAAFQLVPFAANLLSVVNLDIRAQSPNVKLSWSDLGGAFTGGGIGSPGTGSWGSQNVIESFSYVGAFVVVLAVAALALRTRRRDVPVVWFFAITLAVSALLTYGGGPLLALAQELPIFSNNFVGRLRVMVGFFTAILAAFGLANVLRRTERRTTDSEGLDDFERRVRRFDIGRAAELAAATLFATACFVLVARNLEAVPDENLREVIEEQLWTAGALGGSAVLVLAAWATRRRWLGAAALSIVPVAVLIPAVLVANSWWGTSPVQSFYPATPAHTYLENNLGTDRYASVGNAMWAGTNAVYGFRSVGGHAFMTQEWKDLLLSIDPDSLQSPTFSTITHTHFPDAAASKVLDRLGVRYLVNDPNATVLGRPASPKSTESAELPSNAGSSKTFNGPVRSISFKLGNTLDSSEGVSVSVELISEIDESVLASTATWYPSLSGVRTIALTGEDIPAETPWHAEITLDGSQQLAVVPLHDDGTISIGRTVPTDDGLLIAHTGDATIYSRLGALPRVHWASAAINAQTDASEVTMMADPAIPATTAILDSDSPIKPFANDSSAVIKEREVETDVMQFAVTATGDGLLVIEDSLRRDGWTASIDGRRADLIPTDHAAAAVAVTEGQHEVTLTFTTPGLREGTIISVATLVLGLILGIVSAFVRRSRRKSTRLH